MVEVEVEYTLKYMEVLRRLGKDIPQLDQSLCHIIASGMFNAYPAYSIAKQKIQLTPDIDVVSLIWIP